MRKILTILGVLVLITSCVQKPDFTKVKPKNIEVNAKYKLDSDFNVPTMANKISVVTYFGDTLAITDAPMAIKVPKYDVSSKASTNPDVMVSYVNSSDLPSYKPGSGIARGNYVLMFEDSQKGDYDYNDLVLYANHEIVYDKKEGKTYVNVRIKPIALGSSKKIAFGYDDYSEDGEQAQERILSHDVRTDYFDGVTGMLNTSPEQEYVVPIETIRHENNSTEGWYTYSPSQAAYNNNEVGSYLTCRNYIMIGKEMNDKTKLEDKMVKSGYICYAARVSQYSNPNKTKTINYFVIVDDGIKYSVASVDKTIERCLPYGLAIPEEIGYPKETINVSECFPRFMDWATGNGNAHTNWFKKINEQSYYSKHLEESMFRW